MQHVTAEVGSQAGKEYLQLCAWIYSPYIQHMHNSSSPESVVVLLLDAFGRWKGVLWSEIKDNIHNYEESNFPALYVNKSLGWHTMFFHKRRNIFMYNMSQIYIIAQIDQNLLYFTKFIKCLLPQHLTKCSKFLTRVWGFSPLRQRSSPFWLLFSVFFLKVVLKVEISSKNC